MWKMGHFGRRNGRQAFGLCPDRIAFAAQPPECRNATVKERANVIARPCTLAHTRVSAGLTRFGVPVANGDKY